MKIPLSLIEKYIDISSNLEETLTLLGIEVDVGLPEKPPFSGVVAGLIKKVDPHPHSNGLWVAQVFDGKETLQIVCGAPNCKVGILAPLAKMGAHLNAAEGSSIHICKTEIKGVESFGMLCSASELSIYDDTQGILELPDTFHAGADLAKLLWDPVLELSFTPNLGHFMSAIGIARELSASWKKPLKKLLKRGTPLDFATVEIHGVSIGPSPFWLQKVLRAAKMRSINNVVDITNYFLLTTGQPMHAYDAQLVEGDHLQVKKAKNSFDFKALDEIEYKIPSDTLVIEDAKKVVALAGIMGGANSAVTNQTTNIILEVAAFDPISVRKASRKIGLRSESSSRFEKGIDKGAIKTLLEEASQLICELAGGKIGKKREVESSDACVRTVSFRPAMASKLLGVFLSENEVEDLLSRLEMPVLEKKEWWTVSIPSYRNDLQLEIDLVEEVGRLYGYNHLPKRQPKIAISPAGHDPEYLFEKQMRVRLVALGLQEFLTCDLISPRLALLAQELSPSQRALLEAKYCKSEEYSILRPSLLPGLLQIIKNNLDQKANTLAGFELGRIHFKENEKVVEIPMAAILLTGQKDLPHWDKKERSFDFFDLKGMIEDFFEALKIPPVKISPAQHRLFHPGRQAEIQLDEEVIGTLGELHPALLIQFGIEQKVLFAEINAQSLQKKQIVSQKTKPLALFPSSERDWTIPLPTHSYIGDLLKKIRSLHLPLLESVDLIDLYRKEDMLNATFRFIYRDRSKTLSFEEVESAHTHLMEQVLAAFAAK